LQASVSASAKRFSSSRVFEIPAEMRTPLNSFGSARYIHGQDAMSIQEPFSKRR
jgi:hypothetical protein